MTAVPTRYPTTIHVSKDGDARFLGNLDFHRLVERSLRRSGLPLLSTQGFHPRIKIAFADALPVGTASLGEAIGMTLTQDLSPADVADRLTPALPECVRLVSVVRGALPEPAAQTRWFVVVREHAGSAADALIALLESSSATIDHPRRPGTSLDVRPLVAAGQLSGRTLVLDLRRLDGKPPRPGPVLAALEGLARRAGLPPPVFGHSTKSCDPVRHGADSWHAADVQDEDPAAQETAEAAEEEEAAGVRVEVEGARSASS